MKWQKISAGTPFYVAEHDNMKIVATPPDPATDSECRTWHVELVRDNFALFSDAFEMPDNKDVDAALQKAYETIENRVTHQAEFWSGIKDGWDALKRSTNAGN